MLVPSLVVSAGLGSRTEAEHVAVGASYGSGPPARGCSRHRRVACVRLSRPAVGWRIRASIGLCQTKMRSLATIELADLLAASVGEPLQPGWPVIEIERLISRCGLKVVDHPARADLEQRYFADRTDGLRPYNVETLVTARVT